MMAQAPARGQSTTFDGVEFFPSHVPERQLAESQESQPTPERKKKALLAASLRASVFNPEFLDSLDNESVAEAVNDAQAVEQENFPSLLEASLDANVFNEEFLDLIERRAQHRIERISESCGVQLTEDQARRVAAKVEDLLDEVVHQAVDEELQEKQDKGLLPLGSVEVELGLPSQPAQDAGCAVVRGKAGHSTGEAREGHAHVHEQPKTDHRVHIDIPHGEALHHPAGVNGDSIEGNGLPPVPVGPLKQAWRLYLQPHPEWSSMFELLLAVSLLVGVWLCSLWLAVGGSAAPNGQVWALVIVYIAAVVCGELAARLKTHPLVGMLLAGFICRYIPGVKAGDHINAEVAAVVREFGLCTILLRAGLSLNLRILLRFWWLSIATSIGPTVVEAAVVAAMSVWLLALPWTWAFMAGFIVAGCAPAIVVPALLHLQEHGFGVDQGIPSLVLAVSAVDDVLSVIGNAAFFGVIFQHQHLALSIFRAPIEILMGLAVGGGLGLLGVLLLPAGRYIPHRQHKQAHEGSLRRSYSIVTEHAANTSRAPLHGSLSRRLSARISIQPGEFKHQLSRATSTHLSHASSSIPRRSHSFLPPSTADDYSNKQEGEKKGGVAKQAVKRVAKQATEWTREGSNMAFLRTAFVLGFGMWAVLGGNKIEYGGAGAMAVVVLGVVTAQGWGRQRTQQPQLHLLYIWSLVAQPLLFGVIGAQINVSYFKGPFLWRAIITLLLGSFIRCLITVALTIGTELSAKERTFLALAWLPKATVQAALAPQALGKATTAVEIGWGQTVFALGMLSVILTAPVGAVMLRLSGPRLLKRSEGGGKSAADDVGGH